MNKTDTPPKIKKPFAWNAVLPYVAPVPEASQVGIQDGRASFETGYPPLCFVPISSGGAGPFGEDMNGLSNQISAGVRWLQAGGPLYFDDAIATGAGGYPAGAILQSATIPAIMWFSLSDGNTGNPDLGAGNWSPVKVRFALTQDTTFYCNFATGSDSTGTGTLANPWKTLQFAVNYILNYLDPNGFFLTIDQSGNDAGCKIVGGGETPINIKINGVLSSFNTIWAAGGANLNIFGPGTLASPTGSCVAATGGSIIAIEGLNLGNAHTAQLYATENSLIQPVGNFQLTGDAPQALLCEDSSSIRPDFTNIDQIEIIVQNTPNYSTAFLKAQRGGSIFLPIVTPGDGFQGVYFNGTATGARVNCTTAGGVDTQGSLTSLPGNSAGTTTSPGWSV